MIKASTDKVVSRDALINLFKQLRLADKASDYVNDSDPMWTLNTPDLFAGACIGRIYANLDDYNDDYRDAIGRPLSEDDIHNISDWIYDECSHGDFDV